MFRMKVLVIILFYPFFVYADTDNWIKITRTTFVDSVFSKTKEVGNETVHYIDEEMQLSACIGAKKHANESLKSIEERYSSVWPNSQFRLYYHGDCTYNNSPGEKSSFWSIKASIDSEIQRSDKPLEPEPNEQCSARTKLSGTYNNVYNHLGNRYIYVDGCEYEGYGVIVCKGDSVCAADWVPTGNAASESDTPSYLDDEDTEPSNPGENGGSGEGNGNGGTGGNNNGNGSSGSSISKSDISSAVHSGVSSASPAIATAIHDKLTEPDETYKDQSAADKQSQQHSDNITSAINNLMRGAGRFATGSDNPLFDGDSELDTAIAVATNQLGIDDNSHGSIWDAFLNVNGFFPNLPNGNGCESFVLFPGDIYEVVINCDKLLTIKELLSWVMYCLTFWYVFSSATNLLRKE